jgi:hypothetical protein
VNENATLHRIHQSTGDLVTVEAKNHNLDDFLRLLDAFDESFDAVSRLN